MYFELFSKLTHLLTFITLELRLEWLKYSINGSTLVDCSKKKMQIHLE